AVRDSRYARARVFSFLATPGSSGPVRSSLTRPASTAIATLSLHDALPICTRPGRAAAAAGRGVRRHQPGGSAARHPEGLSRAHRSEEHTSELQSPDHLVCRLLLEKKKEGDPAPLPLAAPRCCAAPRRRVRE